MEKLYSEAIKKNGYPLAFIENDGKTIVYDYSGLTHLNTDWEMAYIDEIKIFDFSGGNLPNMATIVYMIDSIFDMNFFSYDVILTEEDLRNKFKRLGIEYQEEEIVLIIDELKKIPTVNLDFFNEKGLNFGDDDSLHISEISGENIIIKDLTNSKTIIISADPDKNSDIPLNIEANKGDDWIEVYDYNFGDIDLEEINELKAEGYDLSVVINGDFGLEFTAVNAKNISSGVNERFEEYINLFKRYFPNNTLLSILKLTKEKIIRKSIIYSTNK